MSTLKPTLIDDLSEMLGGSIGAVFTTVLDLAVESAPESQFRLAAGETVVCGTVGFIGEVEGMIHVSVAATAARSLALRMLALEPTGAVDDRMVDDVIGELGNMAVGAVKSLLCDRELPCELTIPQVRRASAVRALRTPPVESRRISLACEFGTLLVDIEVEDRRPKFA
ncbi:MAG: chemotaxis protein CheX [Opitutaceae bacterium]|nr:chemotaxis protein CheX [Opitutaceae bacterium]